MASRGDNAKFDPSDYLPRRTSRASAHAASDAIKKSVVTEKVDPAKLKSTETGTKPPKRKSSSSSSRHGATSVGSRFQASGNEFDCFVKVVRCEEVPAWKDLVLKLLSEQKRTGLGNRKRRGSSSDDEWNEGLEDVTFSRKKALQSSEAPNSKYKVVYAPIFSTENNAFSHIDRVGQKDNLGSFKCANADGKLEDLKQRPPSKYYTYYQSNGPAKQAGVAYPKPGAQVMSVKLDKQTASLSASSSTARSNAVYNFDGGSSASAPQKSVSLVMVHPKPGTKIISNNVTWSNRGRKSLPTAIHQLIADPNTVINNTIEQVVTSAGKYEVPCGLCGLSFRMSKDLVAHKRMAHKCLGPVCPSCGSHFKDHSDYEKHNCQAKYRCGTCGLNNPTSHALQLHLRQKHPQTERALICQVCCYNAITQAELNSHVCGGRPAKGTFPGYKPAPKVLIMTSKPSTTQTIVNSSKASGIGIPGAKPGAGGNESKKFLCQDCLEMFSTTEALSSHICSPDSVVLEDDLESSSNTKSVATASTSVASHLVSAGTLAMLKSKSAGTLAASRKVGQPAATSFMPVDMNFVLPEVEQLAKFYSSVVFQEK